MISIIVCSRHKKLPDYFLKNIEETVGTEYEIIHMDNSENQYSIFAAYNQGFARSKYPYLCFVHEDVKFHTPNWGENVIEHLQKQKTGIVGLAGGNLASRIPASWSAFMSSIKIIQADKTGRKPLRYIHHPSDFAEKSRSVILLDGVLLCMKRELMQEIKFDEQFDGFHGYDFDISIQSTVAGYTNYVMYDVDLEHFSHGKPDAHYYRNLIAIFKKWGKYLPLIGKNISDEQREQIPGMEEKRLSRLIRLMTRTGFMTDEIIKESTYFANVIGSKKSTRTYLNQKFRIYFLRLFTCPKYLFLK